MPWADDGTIKQKINAMPLKDLTENQVLLWYTQIALGMQELHSMGVMHRNLNNNNVMLFGKESNGIAKVTDFFKAVLIPQTEPGLASSLVGQPQYMAPEMLRDDKPYTFKVDVWSSGILLYFMCTKKYPYPGLSIKAEILMDAPTLDLPPERFSDDFRKLVSTILIKNVYARPNFSDILEMPIIQKQIDLMTKNSIYGEKVSRRITDQLNETFGIDDSMRTFQDGYIL